MTTATPRIRWAGFFRFVPFFIGAILIGYIALNVDLARMWTIARSANPTYFVLAFLLVALEIAVKAFKLKTVASPLGLLSTKDSFITYLIGVTYGLVTPGQIGDFAKVYILKKKADLSMVSTLAVVFVERALELVLLLLLAIAGLSSILVQKGMDKTISGLLIGAVVVVGLLVLLLKRNVTRRGFTLISRFFLKSRALSLESSIDEFYQGVGKIATCPGKLLMVVALMLLWWGLAFLHFYFLGLALNLHITYLDMVRFIPVIIVVELVPVTVMGFGTREYAMVFLLGMIGITLEESVALSLISFVFSFVPQVLPGYFLLIKEHMAKNKSWKVASV